MSYRRAIATALLALSIAAPVGCARQSAEPGPIPFTYDSVCPTAAEDSAIVDCELDPSARYDYDRGAWRIVSDDYTYANGNQPPTGAQIMADQ